MAEWWAELTGTEKVFWILAIPSTIIFLFVLVLNLIAGVDDGDMYDSDGNIDTDMAGEIGFQFLTFKTLLSFFTIFSWTGIVCIDAGFSEMISILIGTASGIAMMAITAWFYYFMGKMSESGTLVMSRAINAIGEVYLPIPPRGTGIGKVQLKLQGSFRELDAITDDEVEIKRGEIITVTEVINGGILKVKSNQSN